MNEVFAAAPILNWKTFLFLSVPMRQEQTSLMKRCQRQEMMLLLGR